MKKSLKKTVSLILSAMIMLTSVILPMSAMAADTLTAETNVITSSQWYNISYSHGDAHINMEFQNVDKDGKIHVKPGEPAVIVIHSGAYSASSDNRLNEVSWHYRNNNDADGITTDIAWTAKTDGWMPAKVEGFGASTNGNPKAVVNSTDPIITTITTEASSTPGEHSLEISYKYQMKYQEWFSFKTGKETGASASTVNFTIVVEDGTPTPVHQHTYDKVVTAPTCTTDGYTTYTCNNSDGLGAKGDDVYTADKTNKLNHDFKGTVVSNQNGTHKIACTRFDDCKAYSNDEQCKYSYSVITPATSTHTGLGRYTCNVCGYSYDEIIETTDCTHSGSKHTENRKNATCTESGYTGDTVCDICNAVIETGKAINALGHKSATKNQNEVKGNCVTAGSYDKITYCSVCNTTLKTEKITTAVDKNNHTGKTAVINEKAATCKENGYTGDTICADCKAVIKAGTVIDKSTVAHTGGTAVKENEIAGTCAKAGSYDSVVYCTVCNAEVSRERLATSKNPDNHSGETEVKGKVDPTQDEFGYTGDVCCKDCGAVLEKGTQIDKLSEEKPFEPSTDPTKPTEPTDPAEPTKPSEDPTEPATKPVTEPTTKPTTTQKNDEKITSEKNTATTTTTNKDTTVKNNSKTSPNTGADTDVAVMISVAVFAAAMFVLVVAKKKKFVK